MENKKYMKELNVEKPIPYAERAAHLDEMFAKLKALFPSAKDRARLAMAIQLENARCSNVAETVVRTLDVIILQPVPLTLDEAMFALNSLVEYEGRDILASSDQQLASKVAETALLTMRQVMDEYPLSSKEDEANIAGCIEQIHTRDFPVKEE